MNPQSVLTKTEKGAQEIETREHKLDQRTRALLLVVNGKTTVGELVKNFARLGDVSAMLKQLLRDGFIKAEASVEEVRKEAALLIYNALGPNSNRITLEVEDCKSLDELRRYVTSRRELFQTALGEPRAGQLWTKLTALLR